MDDYNALIDINTIYSDADMIDTRDKERVSENWGKTVYFYEGLYEGEGADASRKPKPGPHLLSGRELGGALFGNYPIWHFGGTLQWCGRLNWTGNLSSPGSKSMSNIGKLIRSRRWYNLVPDYDNTVVTSSKGSWMTLQCYDAREKTGETVMVWCPTTAQITVNMTKISGTQANCVVVEPG